jgi:hypothetical protein
MHSKQSHEDKARDSRMCSLSDDETVGVYAANRVSNEVSKIFT